MNSAERAENLLISEGYTCVLCRGEEIYPSDKRGVAPLLELLSSGKDFSGFAAADKTVGAGAAYLYVLLGIREVRAGIISSAGLKILEDAGIVCRFKNNVPYIINRAGDGMCPIESAVKDAGSPEEALAIIKQTLGRLKG